MRRTQHKHREQTTLVDEDDLLTPKQRVFADEMLRPGTTGRAAYIKAYGPTNPKSADTLASRLLKNVKVNRYLDKLRTNLSKSAIMSAQEVLEELSKIGRFDPRKMFNSDGSPKQILELDDDTAVCVAGLEVCELFEGQGDQKHVYGLVKKIKITDKRAALVDLGKHHALFTDKQELSGPDGSPLDLALKVVFVDGDE